MRRRPHDGVIQLANIEGREREREGKREGEGGHVWVVEPLSEVISRLLA